MEALSTTLYTDATRPMREVEKEETKEASPRLWQAVLVGGIPGILIGAGGKTVYDEITTSDGPIENDGTEASTPVEEVIEVQVAHSVTDAMSFGQAFATARAEIGPGGAFVWHGNVYTTFRADDVEWQEMTDEARLEFSNHVMSQVQCPPYSPTENEPEIVAIDDAEDMSSDVDVHIVGIGQHVTSDGDHMLYGYGAVDGHYSEFIDTDGDGEVDTVLIDANDNHHLDSNEIIDADGSGITVQDLADEVYANSGTNLEDLLNPEAEDYSDDHSMNIPV